MNDFPSDKVKELLNTKYGYNIYKIIAFCAEKIDIYMAFIYLKTDDELKLLSDSEKDKIKSIYIDYLKEKGYIPDKIKKNIFYFDTDENVQKHYGGNYFYATR